MKAHEHPELFREHVIKKISQEHYDHLKFMAYSPQKVDLSMVLIGLKEWEKEIA